MSDNEVIGSIEPELLDLESTCKGARQRRQQQAVAAVARRAHQWPQGPQVHRSAAGAESCGSWQPRNVYGRAIGTDRRDCVSIAVIRTDESPSDVEVSADLKPGHPAASLISQKEGPVALAVNGMRCCHD